MNKLLKILSDVLEEEKSKDEKDKFKNLTDLYNLCVSKGYIGDIEKFKSEYSKLVEQCSNMLKTSELSDFDLESVAGGVNINVSLKSSLAMIMSALSLGSASGIASAANPKSNTNNSSISNKVNTWDRSKSNLTNGQVLATGLGAAAVGALGTALISIPITAAVTSDVVNSFHEFDAMNNVVRLIYSLNAEDSESVSFNKLTNNERQKLIKSAYSELNIKLDNTTDISKELVRTTLLSKLNEQIAKLNKNNKSKEVQLKLSRLSLLKMCLETKSNGPIGTSAPGVPPAPGMPPIPPAPGMPPIPPAPGMPPIPPAPGMPGAPGAANWKAQPKQQVQKKEVTEKEQRELDEFRSLVESFERQIDVHLKTAEKNQDSFANKKAYDCANRMLSEFKQAKDRFSKGVLTEFKEAIERNDVEKARVTHDKVFDAVKRLKQLAENILNADRRMIEEKKNSGGEDHEAALRAALAKKFKI